ncbi:FliM/FliN family flagellar motor switch protein [Legionella sp. CNM-4043-24]|uniref:FliM/FliN family flagellar motor switch protein n=1 Tax=Legionella sp. CNM-4043-24 TaxID=3421646 RepID=UPI00403B3846
MSDDEIYEFENPLTDGLETPDTEQRQERVFTEEHIDILNDVVMDITVEIGRAKMKISELLNLKKGSIIELAQGADEPLHIFANEKLIAKGVIISANGKYCVKIT